MSINRPLITMAMIAALILTVSLCASTSHAATVITLGGVLSSPEYEAHFHRTVAELSESHVAGLDRSISFNSTTLLMNPNPIRSALAVCDDLLSQRVSAVVVSHPPNHTQISPISVSYTCGYYQIPVVGIYARDSVFSDKRVHVSFVRTVPPYAHQAYLWIELLRHFEWRKVIFVHSTDEEGWSVLHNFRGHADTYNIQIEEIVRFTPGEFSYMRQLSALIHLQSRVVLLYATTEESVTIFDNARTLNLTGLGYAWIVTEQALSAPNVPIGTIGGRLLNKDNEKSHIKDSIHILAKTFLDFHRERNITTPPTNCKSRSRKWASGDAFFRKLMASSLKHGETGRVSFDENGDRVNPVYEIVNIRPDVGVVCGHYGSTKETSKPLFIPDKTIVYMGNTRIKPKGMLISTHLRILTVEEDPFVYKEPLKGRSCLASRNESKCTHTDPNTGKVTEYCCWGYCIELAYMLANSSNFTFDVFLSKDGFYGVRVQDNVTKKFSWNGMVGELMRNEGDAILGAFTMNPERANQIDFTQPYKYLGLTILVKKGSKESSLASFLQPFQDTLWILVGLSVHVVALVLYLLDRFSPFGRFKPIGSDEPEEDALNLSSAMWFSWGVLLNSGIGEGTPRSFSARVLGMVWAGFAMIIIASYTANLAAFLVLDRPEASITGITDPRLRNPTDKFQYATVKNSGADMYFKRQVDLSTMSRTMEGNNYDTAKEAIADLKTNDLQAFIWDSPRLEFEAARDCDLVTAGELFGRTAFSIGLQKDSPWNKPITRSILQYHEGGMMEKLDSKWILIQSTECPSKSLAPATLSLTNMAGVFMMVAGGILGGVLLIAVEIVYRRHQINKEKRLGLARHAIVRWRNHIEKRRALRETREFIEAINGVDAIKGRAYMNHHQTTQPNHGESEEMLRKLHRQREEMRGMKPADMPADDTWASTPLYSAPPPYPRDEIEATYVFDTPSHRRRVMY